jgi:hypothetical protein
MNVGNILYPESNLLGRYPFIKIITATHLQKLTITEMTYGYGNDTAL